MTYYFLNKIKILWDGFGSLMWKLPTGLFGATPTLVSSTHRVTRQRRSVTPSFVDEKRNATTKRQQCRMKPSVNIGPEISAFTESRPKTFVSIRTRSHQNRKTLGPIRTRISVRAVWRAQLERERALLWVSGQRHYHGQNKKRNPPRVWRDADETRRPSRTCKQFSCGYVVHRSAWRTYPNEMSAFARTSARGPPRLNDDRLPRGSDSTSTRPDILPGLASGYPAFFDSSVVYRAVQDWTGPVSLSQDQDRTGPRELTLILNRIGPLSFSFNLKRPKPNLVKKLFSKKTEPGPFFNTHT